MGRHYPIQCQCPAPIFWRYMLTIFHFDNFWVILGLTSFEKSALVGRYANRIKNGTFEINGQKYFTPINEHGVDTLHGGFTGTDRLNWTITDKGNDYIVFESWSHTGDQGFPGNLLTKVKCE